MIHSHVATDGRRNAQDYIVGTIDNGKKPKLVSQSKLENYSTYTKYGSVQDWKTIDTKIFDGMGRIPLNSFGIIAPIDGGGWKETERKRFGVW